ncbi:MAG: response regulator transcription factor [Firmicutes bacterium]|nr:response regulator transcription factor [Bacillota bacterium]MBQ4091764.1 response regulator transcription factor [Bacillota bacterium]
MKLLYAEDEPAMSEAVVDILTFHHFTVDAVFNGKDALDYAENEHYDGIILDIMMPKMSGTEVLQTLRKKGCKTPILLLTAKSEVEDIITGLDLGADDYLAKPFAMGELIARVRAMLRRKEDFTPDILSFGELSLNRQNFELRYGENSVFLPKLEFQIMELLMLNCGIYLSTETILTRIWGYDTDAEIGIVWVYISYLRKKLSSLCADIEICAKRGIGYALEKHK